MSIKTFFKKLIGRDANNGFPGSSSYWEQRYANGGNSGAGSYNNLAEFKAEVLNNFIKENNIHNVIEFGCGDGNQLSLINYPKYIGLDVAKTAIIICKNKFRNDKSKSFYLYDTNAFVDNHKLFHSELSISLDVIYHLIEDEVFNQYMEHLFDASSRFVLIYASNFKKKQTYHEKDRVFTEWVERNKKDFRLVKKIDNRYKYDVNNSAFTSKADFFIYEKLD